MKPKKTIQTPYRFFYLNTYAFLLLLAGVGIGMLPIYTYSLWGVLPQAVVCLLCLYESARIFSSWQDKKRKYRVLMQRNAEKIRPDTFAEYMQAPCGRLLVRVVLVDLRCPEQYRQLQALRKPWRDTWRENCRPKKTVIHSIKLD